MRLAVVERLLLLDASPAELRRELDLPSNLLAHHLGLLEQARLVARGRSEGDVCETAFPQLTGLRFGCLGTRNRGSANAFCRLR